MTHIVAHLYAGNHSGGDSVSSGLVYAPSPLFLPTVGTTDVNPTFTTGSNRRQACLRSNLAVGVLSVTKPKLRPVRPLV